MTQFKEIGNETYKIITGKITFNHVIQYLKEKEIFYSKLFILVDDNTEECCLPDFVEDNLNYTLLRIQSGEEYKSIETAMRIWQQLMDCEADRQAILINLGGGVICDLGGFVASCYKRGIRYINIPTTLLAQVDASVGAKTGIDFGGIKNSIGTFYIPIAVFVSDEFFRTLPLDEIKSGYAEVIKHAMLQSREKVLQSYDCFNAHQINEALIAENILYKLSIVSADPFEKAERKFLNFGHTVGHAVESMYLLRCRSIFHGEAVAFGILVELYLSARLLGFPRAELRRYKDFFKKNYLNLIKDLEEDVNSILFLMQNDKKNVSQQLNFTLLSNFGEPKINQFVQEDVVKDAIVKAIKGLS